MLTGKVALVTGGSRGIGAAIVTTLAGHGADVALTYSSSAEQAADVVDTVKASGARGLAMHADSARPDDVVRAVEQTVEHFGRLDILVNNAGVAAFGRLEDLTVDDIDRTLAIHVRAALRAAQAAAQHMDGDGRIISIGSNLAERVPSAGMTLYAASKSALVGMTRGLARDLGDRGITANVVNPGPTDTEMNPASGPAAEGQRTHTALGRYGDPADVAGLVAYLAGPGGRTVTGASILVDAGSNA